MKLSHLLALLLPAVSAVPCPASPLDNPHPSRIDPSERLQIRQSIRAADLETKINYLVDRSELLDLIMAYGYSVDLRDWELHRSLFLDNYHDGSSGTFKSASSNRRIELLETFFETFEGTQHLSVPIFIRIDGDEAFVITTLNTRHFHSDGTPEKNTLLTGQYEFTCNRTEYGWRISHINLVNRKKLSQPAYQP